MGSVNIIIKFETAKAMTDFINNPQFQELQNKLIDLGVNFGGDAEYYTLP